MPHLPFLVSEEEKLAYFLFPIGHPVYPILVYYPHAPPTHSEEGGQGKELVGIGNVPLARDLATIHNRMKYKVQELCLNLQTHSYRD